MPGTAPSEQGPRRKFWGLGWGLFYVISLYFVAEILEQFTGDKRLWYFWVISAAAALVSAMALAMQSAPPKTIVRSILFGAHCLNLTYAFVFAALGFFRWATH